MDGESRLGVPVPLQSALGFRVQRGATVGAAPDPDSATPCGRRDDDEPRAGAAPPLEADVVATGTGAGIEFGAASGESHGYSSRSLWARSTIRVERRRRRARSHCAPYPAGVRRIWASRPRSARRVPVGAEKRHYEGFREPEAVRSTCAGPRPTVPRRGGWLRSREDRVRDRRTGGRRGARARLPRAAPRRHRLACRPG